MYHNPLGAAPRQRFVSAIHFTAPHPYEVALDVAVYSKLRSSIVPEATVGMPSGILLEPRGFDSAFRFAATPPAEMQWNEGMALLDPDTMGKGGWTVRVIQENAYLACQRYVCTNPDAPHLLGRGSAAQCNYLEQITFRVPIKMWQTGAARIADAAQDWLEEKGILRDHLAKQPEQEAVLRVDYASALAPTPGIDAFDFANLPTGLNDPSVVLHTGLLPKANRRPLVALLSQLTPEQLRWASFAYGYRSRFPGISIQIFDQDKLSFSETHEPGGELAYVNARNELIRTTKSDGLELQVAISRIARSLVGIDTNSQGNVCEMFERIDDFWHGAPRDLSGWSIEQVSATLRVCDAAMDTLVSLRSDVSWLTDRYLGFMRCCCNSLGDTMTTFLQQASFLEFAPGFLSNLPSFDPQMSDPILDALVQLRKHDRDAYRRLTARMTPMAFGKPVFWRHLAKARAENRAKA